MHFHSSSFLRFGEYKSSRMTSWSLTCLKDWINSIINKWAK
jgi:hypothetical protein